MKAAAPTELHIRLLHRLRWWFFNSSPPTQLLLICGVALFLRIVVVAFSYSALAIPSADFGQFGAEMGWVARSLASGQGFSSPFFPPTGPTALVPPFYPSLLAGIFRLSGIYSARSALLILLLNSVFSTLTCIPVYFTVRHAAGDRLAPVAGLLWAVYPFSIYFAASQVWDYALTSFLFACCFYLAINLHLQPRPGAWFGFGVLAGIAVLSNPTVLSVLPFLALGAVLKAKRIGRPWLLQGCLVAAGVLLAVGPWAVRNDRAMHFVSPVRDGFWLEFWAGNTTDTSTSNPAWAHPATNPAEMREFVEDGEGAYLRGKHDLAIAAIRARPMLFARSCLRRAIRFWTGFWSFRPGYLAREPLDIPNTFFCTAVTIFMLRGLRRWWNEDRSHATPYLLLVVLFPLAYYLTHSSMDYRQPIEPEVVILVAVGLFGFPANSTVPMEEQAFEQMSAEEYETV